MQPRSLKRRMLLVMGIVLLVFLALTATALDRAYYRSAHAALQEQLLSQLYLLLAAADIDNYGDLVMPARLLETRFSLPSSGLYAHVTNAQQQVVWKSLSTIGVHTPAPLTLPAGEQQFHQQKLQGDEFAVLSYGLQWSTGDKSIPLTFNIALDLQGFHLQLYSYRTTLWSWLGAMAILLLITLLLSLRWGLRPLQHVAAELNAIDQGRQQQLTGQYPQEIQRLTNNINTLLQNEHAQQARYRNALGDLAHSLKTPLAVIRNTLSQSTSLPTELSVQVDRMDDIVAYQLQRAATAGPSPTQQHLAVRPLLAKITYALDKVYRDKQIHFRLELADDCQLRMDEGDFMELFGNLLDNAAKWCRQQIRLHSETTAEQFILYIDDDGPGIDAHVRTAILERGQRADSKTPGQGIGLAVVNDIVMAYHGDLSVTNSPLGGARFRLAFPHRQQA